MVGARTTDSSLSRMGIRPCASCGILCRSDTHTAPRSCSRRVAPASRSVRSANRRQDREVRWSHAPHPPRTPGRACQRASRGDNYHLLACSFVLSNALTWNVLSAATALPATSLSPPIDPTARIVVFFPAVKDRKSTRLNSSHGYISYAVFCLKKKTVHRVGLRHPSLPPHPPP